MQMYQSINSNPGSSTVLRQDSPKMNLYDQQGKYMFALPILLGISLEIHLLASMLWLEAAILLTGCTTAAQGPRSFLSSPGTLR